jgi:iron(III) transport system permease protein
MSASISDDLGLTAGGRGARLRFLSMSPLVAALLVVLCVVLVPCIFLLVRSSVHTNLLDGSLGPLTFRYYTDIFESPEFAGALGNTLVYAICTSLLATSFGLLQAWLAERTDVPLRSVLFFSAFISLGIPYTLNTISWLLLLGRNGPVNQVLRALTGADGPLVNVYGLWGMVFIEALTWTPLAFLMMAATMRNSDPSLEEAALMSGGGTRTVLRKITFPLLVPTILAVALLIFTRGLESFEVPALVGSPGKVRVLTTLIYDQMYRQIPPLYGRASAFSIVLIAVVAALLFAYLRILGSAHRYRVVTGKNFRPRVIGLGRWRSAAGALVLVSLAVTIVLPIGILVWTALLPFYQPISLHAISNFTLENIHLVLTSWSFSGVIVNTLVMGVVAGLIATLFGAGVAWAVVRRKKGSVFLDQVAAIPLAFPALVLGLAFLELFLALPFPFYGTLASLILASTIAILPYAVRYAFTGMLQIHNELEEAATIFGARAARTFFTIVLPLIAPSLAASFLFSFLLAVRAMAMLLLLSGPDAPVVAVTIYDMWSNGQPGQLCALGLVWTVITSVVSGGFFVLSRRFGIRAV